MATDASEDQNSFMIIAGVTKGAGPLTHSFGEAMDTGDYTRAHEVATALCTYIDKILPGIRESVGCIFCR